VLVHVRHQEILISSPFLFLYISAGGFSVLETESYQYGHEGGTRVMEVVAAMAV